MSNLTDSANPAKVVYAVTETPSWRVDFTAEGQDANIDIDDDFTVEIRSAVDNSTLVAFPDYIINGGDISNGVFGLGPAGQGVNSVGSAGPPSRYLYVFNNMKGWSMQSINWSVTGGSVGLGRLLGNKLIGG